ncbi:MAG: VWA domain-containing protein [Pseudomonadales bacterium]
MRRRELNPFSLSFLDIMACGFGAATLLFLILKHQSTIPVITDMSAEIDLLEKEVIAEQEKKVELFNTDKLIAEKVEIAQGLARRVETEIEKIRSQIEKEKTKEKQVADLREEVLDTQDKVERLRKEERGDDVRKFSGQGDRQYLTGLKLGGRRTLILVDSSASMLSDTIVNAIRLKNMPESQRNSAAKWRQAVRTAEWLAAQLPRDNQYQVYRFDTRAIASTKSTNGKWLKVGDSEQLNQSLTDLSTYAPTGGTSLVNAFKAAAKLSPQPDNILLITDGLPTQGATRPKGNTVGLRDREKYFRDAAKVLPPGVPVNTILLPMEGDPTAAGAFWQLALTTDGSFLAPARDWP